MYPKPYCSFLGKSICRFVSNLSQMIIEPLLYIWIEWSNGLNNSLLSHGCVWTTTRASAVLFNRIGSSTVNSFDPWIMSNSSHSSVIMLKSIYWMLRVTCLWLRDFSEMSNSIYSLCDSWKNCLSFRTLVVSHFRHRKIIILVVFFIVHFGNEPMLRTP